MTYTDETGRLYVNDTPVYAKLAGGVLHVMVRATDKATFYAVAQSVGLVKHQDPGSEAVLDAEGNVITEAVEPSGPLVPIRDATITEIGAHVITPGEYDDEGNELTPPVLDDRFHANFWLGPSITARGEWESWIVQWMASGAEATQVNKDEQAISFNGVELIDPLSISSPTNVLL